MTELSSLPYAFAITTLALSMFACSSPSDAAEGTTPPGSATGPGGATVTTPVGTGTGPGGTTVTEPVATGPGGTTVTDPGATEPGTGTTTTTPTTTTPTTTTPTTTTPTTTTPTTTSNTTTGGGGSASGPCRSVRLTSYSDVGDTTGCGYRRNHSFIAPFVRQQNLTVAIAQPFYGSSFRGALGEACGECWLVSSATTSAVVMVTNLCPSNGNPLCAEPAQLHFDLSEEAGTRLSAGSNDMGSARPVACPLTGNIHVEVTDRNEWGYFQVALINHVMPVRKVEAKAVGSNTWVPLTWVWGAVWAAADGMFASNGAGGVLRVTSAQGEQRTSTVKIGYNLQVGATLDLGVQFTNQAPSNASVCPL